MSFNFTVIKKNQILAGTVTLMLVTAGYLNYKYDPMKPYEVEITGMIEENLGDAVLVDSNGVIQNFEGDMIENTEHTVFYDGTTPVFQNNTSLTNNKEQSENIQSNGIQNNSINNSMGSGNFMDQNSEKVFKEIEDYFISTRIDRTNNYAEQIESYENVLEGNNVSDVQKNKALEEIEKINKIRNSIMIAENLIKIKGFEEAVILVNEDSINVIVAADNLSTTEVAQLQSIIVNEFMVDISKVHIINYD